MNLRYAGGSEMHQTPSVSAAAILMPVQMLYKYLNSWFIPSSMGPLLF